MDNDEVVQEFLENRPNESAEEREHRKNLPRVCEERGNIYRDKETGMRARLMTAKYSPTCNGCGKTIEENAQVLGISPKEKGNKLGQWLFGCMECAENSAFVAVGQRNPFTRAG
jgi:hypothetical protein